MFKKLFKPVPFPFFRAREKGQGSAEFGTILAGLIVAVLIVIAIVALLVIRKLAGRRYAI